MPNEQELNRYSTHEQELPKFSRGMSQSLLPQESSVPYFVRSYTPSFEEATNPLNTRYNAEILNTKTVMNIMSLVQ